MRRAFSLAALLFGIALFFVSAFDIRVERWSLEDAPIFMGWSPIARLGIGAGAALIAAAVVLRRQH